MSVYLQELRAKWIEVLGQRPSDRQWRAIALTLRASVKILAAVRNSDNRISVLIETAVLNAPQQRIRFQAEGILLHDERVLDDSLFRLSLTLEREDLRDIYETLIVDLISVVITAQDSKSAIRRMVHRLEAWQAFLRKMRRGLSREEQIGLSGELVLLDKLANWSEFTLAIDAWYGPSDGLHDFLQNSKAIEVKSTIGNSTHIMVSNINQLDSFGLNSLFLSRIRFREDANGLSLPQYIDYLRNKISLQSPASRDEFEDRLLMAGYQDAEVEGDIALKWSLVSIDHYAVVDHFPKITKGMISNLILDITYIVDERGLLPYRIDEDDLRDRWISWSVNR